LVHCLKWIGNRRGCVRGKRTVSWNAAKQTLSGSRTGRCYRDKQQEEEEKEKEKDSVTVTKQVGHMQDQKKVRESRSD